MDYLKIEDIEFKEILSEHYDLAIFISGYEKRCINIPGKINNNQINKHIVLGFREKSDDSVRNCNDSYYKDKWKSEITEIGYNNYDRMVSLINKLVIGDKIKILFDYSSASRLWYAGVLNWLKHNPNHSNIMIDFVYSVGIYKEQIEPLVISDTLALPGYEGSTRQYPASLAIIGLGFDNTAVSCLINELEPRITYLYYTNPAAYTEYVEKILEYNKQLISNTDFSVGLPLNRVAHVYKALSEIIFPFINGYNISIIPMGPKPHVLAAILLAFNYKQIQCLRVTGNRDQILHTEASGHYVATRVQYVTY